ncbi:RsmB/NOP family class I SAM-dependent RNA methyltransferase [Clostridiaceae bacterium 35-E11]
MYLPKKYLEKMKILLQDEFEPFLAAYDAGKLQGLRVNTLKITAEDFKKISPFPLKPIPWCENGFYFEESERPAKHPYYHAGLYYIQEPSAMAPVEMLDPHPGEYILDVCAAPGGKSTQIASALKGQGILITNDIHLNRVKAVIKNIELLGIKNAIITNESPEKLKRYFLNYFHRILVDAPCSGEGMFRKDSSMAKTWEKHDATYYTPIQSNIMAHTQAMLKEKGKILYSTCTFSPEENEKIIEIFIQENQDFSVVDLPKNYGFTGGRPEWINGDSYLERCIRLWPHKLEGEGHFLAMMEKKSDKEIESLEMKSTSSCTPSKDFYHFVKENLNSIPNGNYEIHNDNLYMLPEGLPNLRGLKVLRSGWFLGTFKKNRFEPSHALAMGLTCKGAKRIVNFSCDDQDVVKYLKGETLHIMGEKGWTLVCVDNFPLGWAKQTGTMLKNYYPAAWRWLE